MERIKVTRAMLPDFAEYADEIRELWDSHWITNMGIKHEELQKLLEDYLESKHVSLFCNGHMALENALEALHLPDGSEIITTPFTFASTVHAIVRKGYKPVFCDITAEDYTIDIAKIEALITGKTSAILPVHVYGNVCDVESIDAIAKKHGLKVIYDAAHAFGVRYKGKSIFTYGDASVISFHATKVFNTIEGGAICYSDDDLTEKLYELKNFGIRGEESITSVGGNSKMNEFSAAMGICNLRHIDEEILKRKAVYERYISNLSGVSGITLNRYGADTKPNYSYFPVLLDNRNRVFELLAQNGIDARKYFYPIASEYECYKGSFDSSKTPVALSLSNRVLTLPMYGDLSTEDVDRICGIITGEARA